MDLEELSTAAQDCLKVVWRSNEWHDDAVTVTSLSRALGVAPSTTSEMVRRLSTQGLLRHRPYAAIELTAAGERIAVAIVRRHRLIETLLVERLGYSWDEVHDEAEVLEHAVSERLINRIDRALGYPSRDPHGDPIPRMDGTLPTGNARVLAEIDEGQRVRIARISDADPELLRYLTSVGVDIGVEVAVRERRRVTGVLRMGVTGSEEELYLGDEAQRAIWVEVGAGARRA